MGVRNFHFFRISALPRLVRACSPAEKRILLAATLALVAGVVYITADHYRSGTTEVADYGGIYTEGLVGQIRFINPVLATASADADITRIIYAGLLKFDRDQNLVPDLAEELPALSADQKQYTIRLREGLTWHDGAPLTADDVVFTIQLIQNQVYQSPFRLNWLRVEAQAPDERTVVLTLKESSAPFVVNLTQGILPKHVWENVEPATFVLSKYNLQPIGAGPFKIQDLKKSGDGEIKSVSLKAFEGYHGGRPYLDGLEFKFYSTYDELIAAYHGRDVLGVGYVPFDKKVYIEKSSRINLLQISLPQYLALFFNRSRSPVLADRNVRAALSAGINRQEIIDQVYSGAARPAYGPIPPGHLGYNPAVETANQYNPEAAKKSLADAGFNPVEGSSVLKKGEQQLEFTIETSNFPINVKTAELLKQQWEAIGFKVNLDILSVGELEQSKLRTREYEAVLLSENFGADSDPYALWHSSQRMDPGLNFAMFQNKEADQLIVEARSNSDPSYRIPRYERLQKIITDDMPAIFVVNTLYVYGIHTKVRGIDLERIVSQPDRFQDIAKWYIETKRQLR